MPIPRDKFLEEILLETAIMMNLNGHVNILKEGFTEVIADKGLSERVRSAYLSQDMQEFDVAVTTKDDKRLNCTFTAAAIVQLTNQRWVKSITQRNVGRLC